MEENKVLHKKIVQLFFPPPKKYFLNLKSAIITPTFAEQIMLQLITVALNPCSVSLCINEHGLGPSRNNMGPWWSWTYIKLTRTKSVIWIFTPYLFLWFKRQSTISNLKKKIAETFKPLCKFCTWRPEQQGANRKLWVRSIFLFFVPPALPLYALVRSLLPQTGTSSPETI